MVLKKIDELTKDDHHYLKNSDNCHYFGEYTSHKGYNHSPTNNLISNFKKPLEVKNTPQWRYKERAIIKIAQLFTANIGFKKPENVILVPIPPSKKKDDPNYDDRMSRVLSIYSRESNLDFRELIGIKKNIPAFHLNVGNRLTPDELKENMFVDLQLCNNIKPTIVLFDDVITTGSHYKACQELILENYPDSKIIGIFVARRNFPEPDEDFD